MRNLPGGDPCLQLAMRAGIRMSRCVKSFLVIAILWLPTSAWSQALPDAPAPAVTESPSNASAPAQVDWMWKRIQQISDGQLIVVRTIYGSKVRCTFEGATVAVLFCDPPGVLSSQPAYQFDRGSVLSVRESRPESDWHVGLFVVSAVAGTVAGILASRGTTDLQAAGGGLLTAAMVAGVGYQSIQMQGQEMGLGFSFQPRGVGRGMLRPPGLGPRLPMLTRGVGPRR